MQGEKQYKTGLDVGSTTAKIVIIDESFPPIFGKLDKNWATSKPLSQLPAR